ncbi:MAG: Amidophosphoribosyltransferase [Chroococcidiopsis cubana SAG 39.79]|uniref:glutamine--fructose-6-phosphate transaminase (isomerizing) n=1 Tax=Chroococcidiopsis cubana SAG 39.79 TaxID=388085 RepID=A0AB37UPN5_9CYAN|nr:class II glutamine amidotransferase [Chroococcidiopsis cubana]MDZ4876188.1 Amidophosphoribosyltransferase [Chroococcidiopsis cubana SAG 39.79]RUT13404.1 glutamine amidotransferase [Chroococcidiopsis cubana SAG 39.79]
MCGIVGLLIKKPEWRESLGELMVPMLIGMSDRGPDSAGLAVFTATLPEPHRKYSLYSKDKFDWDLRRSFQAVFGTTPEIEIDGNRAVLTSDREPDRVKQWLKAKHPNLHLLSTGRTIDLYKDTGKPAMVADRYNFSTLKGSHAIAHTRMATESAVTPDRAHPFTAGEDFCLVHNGSLSNPYSIRRRLEPLGIHFETDNDTEAACRFLEWRMREGDDLETAIKQGFVELDGFYTFLMGTPDKLALVRDAFACKPAVVAETDDYVAIASEFRSLAHLPDVKNAHLYEPAPEELYVWTV